MRGISLFATFLVTLFLSVSAGCDSSTDPPRDLALSLEVDQTGRPVGEEFNFTFEAEGANLTGLVLAYGDGVLDSIPLFGAQTAGGQRSHAYAEAGVFEVTAELTAPPQGTRTASLSVTVSEAAGDGS